MARTYEQLLQDALHQRRVNEHVDKPDEVFKVDEAEYRTICIQELSGPFIIYHNGLPEEFCGLRLVRTLK